MKKIKINIDGMTCRHCVKRVTDALNSLGIYDAQVEIGHAILSFDDNTITIEKISEVLKEAGYTLKDWQSL